MLAIDDTAADAIREIIRHHDLPEGGGLRIEALGSADEPSALTISPAPARGDDDQVVEHEDVTLFLEPAAAAYLDDKLLRVETDGGGRPSFVVREV